MSDNNLKRPAGPGNQPGQFVTALAVIAIVCLVGISKGALDLKLPSMRSPVFDLGMIAIGFLIFQYFDDVDEEDDSGSW